MLFRRITERVACNISEMISELHQMFCPPTVCGNARTVQNPFSISMRVRAFCNFAPSIYPKASLIESPIILTTSRISRIARTEAQDSLFDYLHCTRGFHLTDAEHISKNSPHFLQNLLSKVENEQDLSRALSKYFRYNPINEFEPFLESLGLNPFEFASLLPRQLIYLGDDQVMLDNFHVLCNYGIPRNKIGKMYKEAKELFGYEDGILDTKLRAYEELGLSKSAVIKLAVCCPMLLVGGIDNSLVGVLEKLKGCGFSRDWIGGYLSHHTTFNWYRMLDTIDFLMQVGYSEKQMGILFKTNPALLFEGSGKQIYVLVGRLLKLGLEMNQVYALFSQNPQILAAKCSKNLWKAICFLSQIGMETEVIANIVATHIKVLGSHSLKGPKTVLTSLKVDKASLCQVIKRDPLKLISLASKSYTNDIEQGPFQSISSFTEKTNFLLRLGYAENSEEMAEAFKKFRGRGDQLQERFDCLVQAGLDCNVVSSMIKQAPSVLNQSKDVIEKKIQCLKNSLGYPLESIVAFPSYLCYDLGRINLRFSMYVWLRERGAAKPMLSLSTLLACSDARFIKYFVDIHPEGLAMWESLKNSFASS